MENVPAGSQSEGASGAYGAAGRPDADAGTDPASADPEALRKALASAEESARTQRDLYLRAAAELDNVRKRAQRDIELAHRYALEGFAAELLAVRDSLELGVRNASNADASTLRAGQEATLKLLDQAFGKFEIRLLDPAGQRFDPAQHEAIMMQESAEAAPNSVLQVVQPGYQLKDRLLRPARVIVAKSAEGGLGEG